MLLVLQPGYAGMDCSHSCGLVWHLLGFHVRRAEQAQLLKAMKMQMKCMLDTICSSIAQWVSHHVSMPLMQMNIPVCAMFGSTACSCYIAHI